MQSPKDTAQAQSLVDSGTTVTLPRHRKSCGSGSSSSTVASSSAAVLAVENVRSGIAQYLEAQRCTVADTGDVAQAIDSTLADTVDSVLRAEHALSERWRPRIEALTQAMPSLRRAELVSWLMQSFDILHLDDALLHSVVLALDRYSVKHPLAEDSEIQQIVLAIICTEVKMAGVDAFPEFYCAPPDGYLRCLIQQLCQGRISMTVILHRERQVLAAMDFRIGLPTPLTFLRSLGVRLQGEAAAPVWMELAKFLLELALLDPELEYKRPHAYLAGAALGVALRVLNAPSELHGELLRDVATIWPADDYVGAGTPCAAQLVAECEGELLAMWMRCSMGIGQLSRFFGTFQAKFGCRTQLGRRLLLLSQEERALMWGRSIGGVDHGCSSTQEAPTPAKAGAAGGA